MAQSSGEAVRADLGGHALRAPPVQWASELCVGAEVPESPHVQREDSRDKYFIQSNSFPQCVESPKRVGRMGSMGIISWLLLKCHSGAQGSQTFNTVRCGRLQDRVKRSSETWELGFTLGSCGELILFVGLFCLKQLHSEFNSSSKMSWVRTAMHRDAQHRAGKGK